MSVKTKNNFFAQLKPKFNTDTDHIRKPTNNKAEQKCQPCFVLQAVARLTVSSKSYAAVSQTTQALRHGCFSASCCFSSTNERMKRRTPEHPLKYNQLPHRINYSHQRRPQRSLLPPQLPLLPLPPPAAATAVKKATKISHSKQLPSSRFSREFS